MRILEEMITKKAKVLPGNVLKVDSFLNHQLDVELLDEMGKEFYQKFKDKNVNKILTIEASGIAIACAAARYFRVPVVFAKKSKSSNIGDDVYISRVSSYTHGNECDVTVSKSYLGKEDTVLLIDDFLAIGSAMEGLIDICNKSGASIAGIGICIEKGFQPGGDELRRKGYEVESLAIIEHMDEDDMITFRN